MIVRILDFLVLALATAMVTTWHDNVTSHQWMMFFAVLATNLLGFARGIILGR